ncbi:ABC transporter permease [Verminephrobacter aporrectodeae subsp. tuberculatae]|uniref:ABC transporter permease n=1 Tax=Verminephrobacter aporrectodeae TaxID=1110389 RepID=UPI0002378261|nr:ABC transporter permease [Verminephrobacter aporrectodeae]MCW8166681.1 ABC transporter permease [Verminephrobacter aporrectodeae subsp. tuberculatae]MCW8170907.1 ABC transporter permease [Verminephrobacter aporrectodeae subsp. tuberculatae]MCW8208679.1 ABC transporter permease [Verminephrobacter aporrectodeae subsp. tuberculatae]
MFDLLSIAARNILRNRRRSLLTLMSIVVGFVALTSFGGFIEFSFHGLRESTIRTQLGHMQIYKEGFWDGHVSNPKQFYLQQPENIEKAISAIDGVETVTRRLGFSGLATVGGASVNVSVTGVDSAREEGFADFETLIDGRQLEPGDKNAGVIGEELRKGLQAKVGDWATVMTTSVDGVINAVDFQVVGVIQTGSKEYDSVFVKVPIELTQRALQTQDVERVIVLLKDTDRLPELSKKIQQALDGLHRPFETRLWRDLAGFYSGVVSLYTGIFNVFSVLIGIVVMFSVANTMTMAVMERTPEIGALRAIGAPRAHIVSMFLLEGVGIGLLGGILGCFAAYGAVALVQLAGGISIPPPPGMSNGYQAFLYLTPAVLLQAFLVTMAASILSSIYPVVLAARMNIVEALQHA